MSLVLRTLETMYGGVTSGHAASGLAGTSAGDWQASFFPNFVTGIQDTKYPGRARSAGVTNTPVAAIDQPVTQSNHFVHSAQHPTNNCNTRSHRRNFHFFITKDQSLCFPLVSCFASPVSYFLLVDPPDLLSGHPARLAFELSTVLKSVGPSDGLADSLN
ncbi:hypothetical protein CISG_01954 [Coccidioides immitis RMSCC 3703]|uniref:Uncharacterized protein n=2 Tax=Coccidioides immitis TaxID=5501 RepID=A0A0J8R466_COCIT|nr:hypothetical protein CIRG_07866 [Coccidioides immitis RMSCC 2394]KMU79536.1 hypothetical protein CISG_01954 [Coccidioides immitis RMSCC 3703]